MNIKRNVYTAAAGLLATCLAAATASAQGFMGFDYSASAGAVSQVSVANLKSDWAVTGVRNGSGLIELITWKSNTIALERMGSATGPAIGNGPVSTVAVTPELVLTAVPTPDGSSALISWNIGPKGVVTLGNTVNITGQSLSVAKLNSSRVVTSYVDVNGLVAVYVYTVSSSGMTLSAGGEVAAGTIPSVAAANKTQFVVAFQTTSGTLEVDAWVVKHDGVVAPTGTGSAGAISEVQIAPDGIGGVATAVRNGGGELEVIDWGVPSTGEIYRASSADVGTVSQIAISTINGQIFTASIGNAGAVDAGVWGYDGLQLQAGASAQGEAANMVAAAPLAGELSVTATRTAAGNLQVDVWLGDYVAP